MAEFELVPFEGPLPLRFGMTPEQVSALFEVEPLWRGPIEEFYAETYSNGISVKYDDTSKEAVEFVFLREKLINVSVRFQGDVLFGSRSPQSPADVLRKSDPDPVRDCHQDFFFQLGVFLTDDLKAKEHTVASLGVFKRGLYDPASLKERSRLVAKPGKVVAFEVCVNGEHVCTAGLASGVCTTGVTWVGGDRGPYRQGHLDLHVGGLDNLTNEHLRWAVPELKVGDIVTIQIVETDQIDPESDRHRSAYMESWNKPKSEQ